MAHKAGFVNIIGRPNVGKSTLMNQLVGERLSIITSKAQTTRHRILGIVNGDDFQIVYSDTPGIVHNPQYELHQSMLGFVRTSLIDADVVIFMTDIKEKNQVDDGLIRQLSKVKAPILLLINKIDLGDETDVKRKADFWNDKIRFADTLFISALHDANLDGVFDFIIKNLPEHPPYYPKDELTDKPEKFFVAEMIREKIFVLYKQEIPYSTEIVIESFKEEEKLIRIRADIYVERKTQKAIIIGKGGTAIKKVGVEARKDIEKFLNKQVYLELFVRVKEGWRDNTWMLKNFGY